MTDPKVSLDGGRKVYTILGSEGNLFLVYLLETSLYSQPVENHLMTTPSILRFEDLKDSPTVRIELPAPIPLGTKLNLTLALKRKHGGRTEELRVMGEFKVTSVTLDSSGPLRQIVGVTSTGVAPSWKAVKNVVAKKPIPAKAPRTEIA